MRGERGGGAGKEGMESDFIIYIHISIEQGCSKRWEPQGERVEAGWQNKMEMEEEAGDGEMEYERARVSEQKKY